MPTTASNVASLMLFAGRFGYMPFQWPVFLGHPVHRHRARTPCAHCVLQLTSPLAAATYTALLSQAEFVPADLPALLVQNLTLGTVERHPDPSFSSCFVLLSVSKATRSLTTHLKSKPTCGQMIKRIVVFPVHQDSSPDACIILNYFRIFEV